MTPCPPVCGFRTSPCVRSKRPRVYQHHAHMFQHVRAWCRYTRGRFERTHGDVLNVHAEAFLNVHTGDTTHNTDRETQRQRQTETETETDRNRERQRETERQRKRDQTRQDKKREDETIKEKKREDEKGETRR